MASLDQHIVEGENDPLLPSSRQGPARTRPGNARASRNLSTMLPGSDSDRTVSRAIVCILFTLLLLFFIIWLLVWRNSDLGGYTPIFTAISSLQLEQGLAKCQAIKDWNNVNTKESSRNNPRWNSDQVPILLRGATVWDPVRGKKKSDLLLDHGIIAAVDCKAAIPNNTRVIDAVGRYITPGVVDMHSHLGVYSWPEFEVTSDGNEITSPLVPQMRAIDGFNTHDPAINWVRSGGVTSSLVIPGSGELMGGEGYVFKLRKPRNNTAAEMLINYGVKPTEAWRWMKMACGENPKNVFGSQGKAPFSRMGSAFLFRQRFAQAQNLLRRQDSWCESAQRINDKTFRITEAFPEAVEDESLVALLRGQVKLNIHCYETYDLEMLLRTSKEYGFNISTFHHALDAYRIPELIKESGVTIATFSDTWGYKKEAYQASVKSPAILAKHGIPVALKSDHPILNAQYLMFEAAKANHYGLGENLSLAAVTSVPANALGLGDRIGRILPGYDADLVIWDKHPLTLGARPLQVIIDGETQIHSHKDDLSVEEALVEEEEVHQAMNVTETEHACSENSHTYTLRQIGHLYADQDKSWHAQDGHGEVMLTVRDGRISCLGLDCKPEVGGDVYYINGGTVLPGLISTGVPLGLLDIELSEETWDGLGRGYPEEDTKNLVRAIDGIEYGTKHIDAALKAGVTTSVTSPFSAGVLSGISVAFRTSGRSGLDDAAIVKDEVALHVQLGEAGKTSQSLSNSAQIAFLRGVLKGNLKNNPKSNYYAAAARGEIPLAVHTNSRDLIAAAVRLRQEIRWEQQKINLPGPGLQLIVIGGAEAFLVADELATEQVTVILQPNQCTIGTWETRRCLPGPPLTEKTGLEILQKAGVTIGLAPTNIGAVRNLIWDAGWEVARHRLWTKAAVGMLTWNIAKAFKISAGSLKEGEPAEFVAYDGSPFELKSRVMLVAGGVRCGVKCYPEQD